MKKLILVIAFVVISNIYIYGQVSEGFEGVTFPPSGWSVSHDLGTTDWSQISSNARSGTKCISSTNPTAGANKTLVLNLDVSSSAGKRVKACCYEFLMFLLL